MDCADGTAFFSPDPFSVFGKNHAGIFQGKFYQFLLGTFLRDTDVYFLLSSGSKPLLDNIRILNLTLEHDLRRDKWRSCIKLLQETGKHLGFCIALCYPEIKVISADQLAISDKKHLHNSILIPEIFALIHGYCDNIAVFLSISCDLLAFSDLSDAADQVAVFHSLFVAHLFGSFLHFFCKFIDSCLKITVQEPDHFADIFTVFFLADVALTGGITLLHVIIKTGSVLACISWQGTVTGTHLIKLSHQLYHIFYCTAACVGAEVSGLVFFHSSGKKHSWIWLINCYLDERITLVILQHGIIFGTVLLDQIAFQNKCFQFRVRNNVLKSGNMRYHLLNLCTFVAAALEILAHTVLKADGFSHVDDLVFFTMHDVDSRFPRKFL